MGGKNLRVSNPLNIMSDHDWHDCVLLMLSPSAPEIIHYLCCSSMIEYRVFDLDLLKKYKLQGANY